MSEQAKEVLKPVFHYECFTQDRLTLMTDKGIVKLTGGQFTTDDPKQVKIIEGSKLFKHGKVWRSNGVIAGANSGKVKSGASGTKSARRKSLSPEDKIQEMKEMGVPESVIESYRKELAK